MMRWYHEPPKPPRGGDLRRVTKFLLLPRCVGNEWRWLEWATIEQKYFVRYNTEFGLVSYWENTRWVDE